MLQNPRMTCNPSLTMAQRLSTRVHAVNFHSNAGIFSRFGAQIDAGHDFYSPLQFIQNGISN
jgi:hypothetical protein